ncbi:FG-GAP-like repeat-containing protein [Candidatus Nitronereus thalassa]|uniref:FG-GAP-like repeat-containing protein n=1 Tax=Candidatus Nitronereus thalassa TaxID=3020898 RepID=A0ABU3K711_9BACT|nr:FG-GAP-like repeat-containing protein [Candidatus Nitronereus thalassa]MDT7042140.1 FG-GAP-like repeat-containing protein [Candidatus Nitronereus thalassa]
MKHSLDQLRQRLRLTLWVSVALLVSGPAGAQNLVLTPVLPADVGKNPEALTVGDFNTDGWQDIATVNSGSDDVTMLFGNGNGTFRSGISFGVGRSPMFLTSGEFNQDGKLDLIVAETGSDGILVLFGKGNGFFEPPVFYPSGKGPTFVSVGDVDGDGDADVVATNSGRFGNYPPYSLSVMLNDGQGRLSAAKQYEVQDQHGLFPTGVSIADLDGDGLPELTVTWSQPSWRTPNGMVSVLKNQGQGDFVRSQDIEVGFTLSAVTQVDLDADGHLDLIAASLFTDSLKVLLQEAPGKYTKPANLDVGFSPMSLAFHDLNADGNWDLIASNRASNSASIFLGRGDGSFQSAGHFAVGATPTSVGVEDFNGDGLPDVVTTNGDSDDVSVLLSGKAMIPSINLSTDAVQFASTVLSSDESEKLLTVSNVGLGALKIYDVVLEGPDSQSFSIQDGACSGMTLATGNLCSLHIRFAGSESRPHHAQLTIWDNAPGGPRIVSLSGEVKG